MRTSARTYSASAPNSRSSVTNLAPVSSWRPETMRRAPSFAKASAVARPIPVRAPVIKTTFVFIGFCLRCGFCRELGVHAAIDCQVRAGDVGRFRSGDECHHRGDLVNLAITVECGGGLLWHRPIARGGIQFGVNWTWLHVVDRDAAAPDFSGQRLSEHLDRSLGARVGHKPGRR